MGSTGEEGSGSCSQAPPPALISQRRLPEEPSNRLLLGCPSQDAAAFNARMSSTDTWTSSWWVDSWADRSWRRQKPQKG